MTLDVFAQYWIAGGAIVDILMIIVGRPFLRSLKAHEIITVIGTILTAWPFILIYIALHREKIGNE